MIDAGDMMRRLALNAVSYGGLARLARPLLGGAGVILMLHRVTADPASATGANRHLAITPDFLDAVLGDMKEAGFEFVTLDEALDRLAQTPGSQRFATVTADDGYRDNLLEALPVLEKHHVPMTIYIAPGLIDGVVDLWWEVVEEIVNAGQPVSLKTSDGPMLLDCSEPATRAATSRRLQTFLTTEVREEDQRHVLRDFARSCGIDPDVTRRHLLMNWDEIRTIASHPLITIGAHTVHHYSLKRLEDERARSEIDEAGHILAARLGAQPRHMAYPYGYAAAVGEREVELAAAAGYASAVTTRHGLLRPDHARHLHALPRLSLNGRYQKLTYIRAMLSGITTPLANGGKLVVSV
ncbi:polysaccharide deacetylase [Pseudaminobacter arsenicus]|uniref:Chitooligosaccharide deacetylase n=1 Tax=Borborobacter arsenicus TaxID=1851146 RepID=A0A432V7D3_9HYPH|nr:polysaccharide deacetylase family protein [Pseudaminobacter arsenicus]RUM98072.1 polysaccharide deacetylase [Pseudaminobacter arsenicus]